MVLAEARQRGSKGNGFESRHQQSFSPMKYPSNTFYNNLNSLTLSCQLEGALWAQNKRARNHVKVARYFYPRLRLFQLFMQHS